MEDEMEENNENPAPDLAALAEEALGNESLGDAGVRYWRDVALRLARGVKERGAGAFANLFRENIILHAKVERCERELSVRLDEINRWGVKLTAANARADAAEHELRLLREGNPAFSDLRLQIEVERERADAAEADVKRLENLNEGLLDHLNYHLCVCDDETRRTSNA